MADKIWVDRRWWQVPPKNDSQYDKKSLAIQFGAIEITWQQAGCILRFINRCRKVTGQLGKYKHSELFFKNYMEEQKQKKEDLLSSKK